MKIITIINLTAPILADKSSTIEHDWFLTQSAYLYCGWRATPIPTVQWFKDGQEIAMSERLHFTNHFLNVENITVSDAGEYECLLRNIHGSASKKQIVNVYQKTEAVVNCEDVKTTIGSTVVLPCKFDVDNRLTNTSVSWVIYKNPDFVDVTLDDDHVKQDDNSLKIMNFKESDVRTYVCVIKRYSNIIAFSEHCKLTV